MAKLMTEEKAHSMKIIAANDRMAKLQKLLIAAQADLSKAVSEQQKYMANK